MLQLIQFLELIIYTDFVGALVIPWQCYDNPLNPGPKDISGTQLLPPVLKPDEIDDTNRSLRNTSYIPSYILEYAPLVHLFSKEKYFPSDVAEYIKNFHVADESNNIIKKDLHELNDLEPQYKKRSDDTTLLKIPSVKTYLKSKVDFSKDPEWLLGDLYTKRANIPVEDDIGDTPSTLIIVDKGNGWVDAYWFLFYSMNNGPSVMGDGPWGSHLGDWEHVLVRFYRGSPKFVYLSAHSSGGGYTFDTLQKRKVVSPTSNVTSERPLVFSASGTHANYASIGEFTHDIPSFMLFQPLYDKTDAGPIWDPSINIYAYMSDGLDSVIPVNEAAKEIGSTWLHYKGHWGDKKLRSDDKRQKWSLFEYKYVSGPRGPLFKQLDRTYICGKPNKAKLMSKLNYCHIRTTLRNGKDIDQKPSERMSDKCGNVLQDIKPVWLRQLARLVMWKGCFCSVMEQISG